MKVANRIVKNTGILYIRMAVTVFMSLYATRLILGALGAGDFGIFNVVAGAIAMMTFLNAAMTSATQRFMSHAEGSGELSRTKSIYNVSVVLHLLIALGVFILLEIVGLILFGNVLKIAPQRMVAAKFVYQFMIISTIFTIISVPDDAVINAHENMLLFSIISIIETIIRLLIAIYITYGEKGDRLITYGILMAFSSLIIFLIRRIYCYKKYEVCRISIKKHYNQVLFKEMTRFAGWNFLTSSVSIISNYGMGIILNVFFGTILNAAQGIANQISGQLSAFSNNMIKALAPVIIKSEGAGKRSQMLKASSLGGKTSFVLALLFMAPFIVDAPYVLSLWLKEVPEYTVTFVRLLLIQTLLESFLTSLSQSLMAEGSIANATKVRAIHNALYLPLIYFAFSNGFSPQSMYYIMLVKTVISILITLYYNKINCGMDVLKYCKEVLFRCLTILSISIGVLFCVKYFIEQSPLRLFLLCILSLFLTILLFYRVVLNTEEKLLLKGVLKSIQARLKLIMDKKLIKQNPAI